MFTYKKHVLLFNKPATTSRGSLQSHTVYYIIKHQENSNIYGIGETAPLAGLSIDAVADFEIHLQNILNNLNNDALLKNIDLTGWPSIEFGIETAIADLHFGGTRKICDNPFIQNKPIPINGLVWMNQAQEMLQEAEQKIAAGFNCIKFKIGALDFDEECRLLESIRKKHNAFKLEIRTDANGAFSNADVFEKLNELKRFDIHSIEQPVKAKQHAFMQEVCAKSPIPVALDEELIGIQQHDIAALLRFIKPQYLILKPTLIGGLAKSKIWIDEAEQQGINWWFTSALESNIGLNAIAQYCSSLNTKLPQGLGTGSLYKNNIESPLEVASCFLQYNTNKHWQLGEIV